MKGKLNQKGRTKETQTKKNDNFLFCFSFHKATTTSNGSMQHDEVTKRHLAIWLMHILRFRVIFAWKMMPH